MATTYRGKLHPLTKRVIAAEKRIKKLEENGVKLYKHVIHMELTHTIGTVNYEVVANGVDYSSVAESYDTTTLLSKTSEGLNVSGIVELTDTSDSTGTTAILISLGYSASKGIEVAFWNDGGYGTINVTSLSSVTSYSDTVTEV